MRIRTNGIALLLTALMAAGMSLLLIATVVQGQGPELPPLTSLPASTPGPDVGSPAPNASQPPDDVLGLQQEIEAGVHQDFSRRLADVSPQNGVGTVSNVQEYGRLVEGLVSVGGYSVTVTLKDPLGVVKSTQTTWPDGGLHYEVNMTTTIQPSETVEVAAGGTTSVIFVDPMSAQLDPANDWVTGTGPANETLDVELNDDQMMGYYTATATVDAAGLFTVTTFYRDGNPVTVDIQPGYYGRLRYNHVDGNQVYLNFGQVVYVHQNYNEVNGYAALNSVPVAVTLYAPDGSVKATAETTSSEWGAGSYWVQFNTDPWGGGAPVPIRGGDTVVVSIEGISTTVPVDLLTATPNLATDTVSGVGPPSSDLKVTINNCYDEWTMEACHQWVTTDGEGSYTAGPFLYHTWGPSGIITQTHGIVAGDTGQVRYTNPHYNLNYINYTASRSRVQENGRLVEGLVPVGGYSVTVTLKDPLGVVKSTQTTWPDGGLHYEVNMTTTIQPSETVEVAAGGTTSVIFVDPMSAQLDPANDWVTGTGPANETLDVELNDDQMMGYYTATATVDAAGLFTVTTFYRDGNPVTVDIQPGYYGRLRYNHVDGNQVYLNFGQVVYVHQNYNEVNGYAALNSVPVAVTLYAPDGSVKATAETTSSEWGAGSYWVQFNTDPWGGGAPVPIRGGDTVVVSIEGISTTVPVDLLTATPNLATDTVSGVGPPSSDLKVTINNCYDEWTMEACHQWVTTDGEGSYTAGPFLYHTWGPSGIITQTHGIVAGDTGQVRYTNPHYNLNYINYTASRSRVQENGRLVEGLVPVGGYSVTVTLKDPLGVVKSTQTTWPDGGLHYEVNMTTTIQPSETVEVAAGGTTSVIFVDPMSAQLDPANDWVTGTGPANETLDVELNDDQMMGYYTATATVDAAGLFTVTTFYRDGNPVTVDIQPGYYGRLRYNHVDGNQVYLNFGQVVYVHQNYNEVNGYAALNSVPVAVTLYAPDGSVKATAETTSSEWGAGSYWVQFNTDPWGGGAPVPIRGGDTVVVSIEGISTTVPVDLLTATPNLATDTVSGVGPPSSDLKVTINNCYDEWTMEACHQWVTTDGEGTYTAGPFLYHTWGPSGIITQTHDIVTGDTGQVRYTNPHYNVNYINYAATGVATTIAAGGLRAGATAVLGTAVPGATVEIGTSPTTP